MKKIFTLYAALFLVGTITAQQTTFCDNFDSYQNGDPIAQTSSDWETWGSISAPTPPYADDANVSNAMSSSGNNSLYLFSGATQGAQDIVLPFGSGAPYTIGDFEFSQKMYVNQNTGAYFNFQAEVNPGITWSLDVKMDLGALVLENTGNGTNFLTTTYPEATWFELKIVVDLTNNNWELFIDGISQGNFTNTVNKIASLDLYPIAGHEFYIDDICYTYTPLQLDTLNAQVLNVPNILGLQGQLKNPTVEIRNLGLDNITSFDVDFDYNGNTITENITGINLTSLATYQFNFTNTISLIGGINTGNVTVYNVNGLGQDDNPNDDTMSNQIDAIIPAPGKLVIGEEATGTWCGWCPRGAVALNWMDKDYEGYWQGIAVHNGDPMTNSVYDAGLAPYIGGYPSGLVDRGAEIDPSAFKQDFIQRVIIAPNGIMTTGAQLNGDTLKVSLTVDFQNSVSGNYKLACVIVEDSVTGVGTQYNQSNSYSGGSSLIDVDGTDWNTLASSVHYSQMIYRHVARSIAPSFNGATLSATSYNAGDSETICYEFILEGGWDQSQIHIVGMLLDNGNQIDNGSTSSISSAVNNGYSSCATTTSSLNLNGPDKVNIFPNPVKDKLYISNLKTPKILVKIYDVNGRLVLKNKVSDKEYLNVSTLSKGIYQIKFESNNWTETRKLIKE